MKIKKIFQGTLPENKILNEKSESQIDTYSCDYINSIIESGKNEKGSWTKFANGTMIVTQKIVASANIVVADGNLFRGNLGSLPDFPIEFSEPPIINLTLTNAFKILIAGQEGSSTTKRAFDCDGIPAIIGIHSATNRTIENVIVNVIAIGNWK